MCTDLDDPWAKILAEIKNCDFGSLHGLLLLLAMILTATALLGLIYFVWRGLGPLGRVREFEIDEATVGVGSQRIKLKPNDTDRQIAYAIWVELSTRKLGLPIDPENDVIEEVYDSWYEFFGITRDLLKAVPISQVRHQDTLKIIELALTVLNDNLRPHLTRWQSRFRYWLAQSMRHQPDISPQERQQQFPEYSDLLNELVEVNARLQSFRETMYALAVKS